MNKAQQLSLLQASSVDEWNRWRAANSNTYLDLNGINLMGQDLRGVNLAGVSLLEANLVKANLSRANLSRASLVGAHLMSADLTESDLHLAQLVNAQLGQTKLTRAILTGADLTSANLSYSNLNDTNLDNADLTLACLLGADLRGASLIEASLTGASVVDANLEGAVLTGAYVYGISAWDVKLEGAIQTSLVICRQPEITVDNLEVAQFIYLLLNNTRIRRVIETITSKTVLILGSFASERKATLEALRTALRRHDYVPILFDFEKPRTRDYTETVSTLAHMARFVIADLTDPRSIPQELTAIIPRLLSVPVRPILLGSHQEWAMFSDLLRSPQVLPPFHYSDDAMLVSCLEAEIIAPAEQRAREMAGK